MLGFLKYAIIWVVGGALNSLMEHIQETFEFMAGKLRSQQLL